MEDSCNSKGKGGRTCLQGQAKRRSKAQSYQEDKLVPYTTAQEKKNYQEGKLVNCTTAH